MDKKKECKRFIEKFMELTSENRRYIIGVQQALIFAQASIEKQESAAIRSLPCTEKSEHGVD